MNNQRMGMNGSLLKTVLLSLALLTSIPESYGQTSQPVSIPKEFELLSKDEVDAYCAAMLGRLARSAVRIENGDTLSFEFFTTQALLVYEISARGVPRDTIKTMVDRYFSKPTPKDTLPYCRDLGRAAYERASEVQRKRAGDRAYAELKKLENRP